MMAYAENMNFTPYSSHRNVVGFQREKNKKVT